MVPETKTAEMLYEFDGDPDRNELPGDGNQLKEKPVFLQAHLLHHAPGVVKRNECFPSLHAGLFEHAIHTNMPTQRCGYENNPSNTHE